MAEGWDTQGATRVQPTMTENYVHPINRKKTVACRYYSRGKCFRGDHCGFLHQKPSSDSSSKTDDYANDQSLTVSTSSFKSTTNTSDKTAKKNTKPSSFKKRQSTDKSKPELADFVNAPEFVPKIPPQTTKSNFLCPFYIVDSCKYGDQCVDIHGEVCDLCGKACLHPTNLQERKKHTEECMKEHERDMELSFAVQRSQDKCCGICMDTIFEKESQNDRRFGILENCNHIFCLNCIRKWRSAKQFENKIVRACPECRVCSDFVTPSKYWVEAEDDKKRLITEYKEALSKKHCKYFQQGRGECPFAGNCFYLHAYPDGRKAELPPPRRRRRPSHSLSHDDFTSSMLWDILEERDPRYLVVNIEDMLDIYVNSSDTDSDSSDLYFFNDFDFD